MVKVIIQTEKETITKEGDFILGSVLKDVGPDYVANNHLVGEVNEKQFPHIVAEVALDILERATKGDALETLSAFMEFKEHIDKGMAERLKARKKGFLGSVAKIFDKTEE